MTFTKGDEICVNRKGRGQFMATVLKDFDTTGNGMAEVRNVDGQTVMVPIKFCKFKLMED